MAQFAFRDFAPRQKRPAGFFQTAEYDNLMDAVRQANQWIADQKVRVLTIETVVLPNVWDRDEEGTADAELTTATADQVSNRWYQFIRVWYEWEELPRLGG